MLNARPLAQLGIATALVSCALASSCHKRGEPQVVPVDAAPSASVMVQAPAVDAAAPVVIADAGPERAHSVATVADAGSEAERVPKKAHTVLGLEDRGLEIWAQTSGNTTDIMGRVLDADGRPHGAPRRLRHTSGEVMGLVATRSGSSVWIAWTANVEEALVVAAERADADLTKIDPPITLLHAANAIPTPAHEGTVRIAPKSMGGVVVASVSTGGPVTCKFKAQGDTNCRGPGWDVFAVDANDAPRRLSHRIIDGGPSVTIEALVDVGGAIFASAWAWHGGVETDDVVLPLDTDAGTIAIPSVSLRPPYAYAWTGDEIVGYTLEQMTVGPLVRGGTAPPAKRVQVTGIVERCEDGHPVIERAHPSGKVKLDPTKPGAFIPELSGWTGRALLVVDDEGRVARRTCTEAGRLGTPSRAL